MPISPSVAYAPPCPVARLRRGRASNVRRLWALAVAVVSAGGLTFQPARAAVPIQFEGNRAYSTGQLTRVLSRNLEFQLAQSDGQAGALAPVVRRLLQAGYRNCGFPDAEVATRVDAAGGLVVTLTEGERYRCGALLFTGALERVSADTLRGDLLPPAAGGVSDRPVAASTNLLLTNEAPRLAFWAPGLFASFTRQVPEIVSFALSNEYARLGHFHSRFSVRLERRTNEPVADLVVDVQSEGPRATIGSIQVLGTATNTADDVLRFLDLREGAALTLDLLEAKRAALLASARFLDARIAHKTPGEDGRTELRVRVAEAPGIPPLRTELSPAGRALQRAAVRINNFANLEDEYELSIDPGRRDPKLPPWRLEAAISGRRGLAAVLRERDEGRPPLAALRCLTSGPRAIYLGQERRRFELPDGLGRLEFQLKIEAVPDDATGRPYNLASGLAFHSGSGLPFRVSLAMHPAALVALAYRPEVTCRAEGSAWTYTVRTNLAIRIDAESGRLLSATMEDWARLDAVTGALDRTVAQLAAHDADWPNVCESNRVLASAIGFAGPAVLRLWNLVVTNGPSALTPGQLNLAVGAAEKICRAAEALPWEILLPEGSVTTNDLLLPLDASLSPSRQQAGMMGILAGNLLARSDELVTPGSWAWAMLRAKAYEMAGQNRQLAGEMTRIGQSPRSGPIALALCARTAAQLDLKFARMAATKGLTRMAAADFARDLEPLLDSKGEVGRCATNLIAALADLTPGEVDALAALLPEAEAPAVRRFLTTLRTGPGTEPAARLATALTDLWEQRAADRFRDELRNLRDRLTQAVLGIPCPSSNAVHAAGVIDLGSQYNDWLGVVFGDSRAASNTIERLTTNLQHIAGQDFDLRGVVLTAPAGRLGSAPGRVNGILVGRACERLHFLQGVLNAETLKPGQNVAEYRVHYADGTHESIPVVAGESLGGPAASFSGNAGPKAAWEGPDTLNGDEDDRIRLYVHTWRNPHPDRVVASIDFLCWHSDAIPYLAALVVE